MNRTYFLYSVKVWLSSVVLSPAAFFIVAWARGPDYSNPGMAAIPIYLLLVAFEFIFSILTWLMFWMIIMLIEININNRRIKRWLIFITGMSLTIGTSGYFLLLIDVLSPDSFPWGFTSINCFFIGVGCWFYYPSEPTICTENLPGPESNA